MEDYKITIGLEVHAELKTKSKMFCGCANNPDEKNPNIYVCPICMGHPGTLPVINKEAVKKILLIGTAVGGEIANFTEFDRKNYFYPDIPKGYQISQYKYPLVSGGVISGVKLTRVHLEEDTARSSHDKEGVSLVDFNRAGVPLMELVTEPVIYSKEQAVNFAKELQLLLRSLGVSDADMEKGQMRVEVNISTAKDNSPLGTKVEIKNINSFRAVAKAIDYEFERQTSLLEKGEKVIQETRGFDETKGITFSQRLKESAHDYRYFPEPDLPKLYISEIPEFSKENLEKELPELPWKKRERLLKFGLKPEDVEIYVSNQVVREFFKKVCENLDKKEILLASNYITSDLMGMSEEFSVGKITPQNFTELMQMISKGELSSRGAKDILKIMFEEGGNPKQIALDKDLIQKNDPEQFKKIVQNIIEKNPQIVSEYKSGKQSTIQFFVGQAMKETKGSGNPEILKKIFLQYLTDRA